MSLITSGQFIPRVGGSELEFFGVPASKLGEVIFAWRAFEDGGQFYEAAGDLAEDADTVSYIQGLLPSSGVWAQSNSNSYDEATNSLDLGNSSYMTLLGSSLTVTALHEDVSSLLIVCFSLPALPSGSQFFGLIGNTAGTGNGVIMGARINGGQQQLTLDTRVAGSNEVLLTPTWTPSVDTFYTYTREHVAGGDTTLYLDGAEIASGTPASFGTGAAGANMTAGAVGGSLSTASKKIRGVACVTGTDRAFWEAWVAATS